MKELKLSQSFSIIALNAQDSRRMTIAKKVSLHCMAAAVILEGYLDEQFTESEGKLILEKCVIDNSSTTLYQETILKQLFNKNDSLNGDLRWWLTFIDTEEWFPNAQQRLDEVKARLESCGHEYTVINEGKVPLIKIDNIIYEAIAHAIQGKVSIHGVRLKRYVV